MKSDTRMILVVVTSNPSYLFKRGRHLYSSARPEDVCNELFQLVESNEESLLIIHQDVAADESKKAAV